MKENLCARRPKSPVFGLCTPVETACRGLKWTFRPCGRKVQPAGATQEGVYACASFVRDEPGGDGRGRIAVISGGEPDLQVNVDKLQVVASTTAKRAPLKAQDVTA
jgi:hypothetical protein